MLVVGISGGGLSASIIFLILRVLRPGGSSETITKFEI